MLPCAAFVILLCRDRHHEAAATQFDVLQVGAYYRPMVPCPGRRGRWIDGLEGTAVQTRDEIRLTTLARSAG